MEQPKREGEKDEEPVSSYWYDQEALNEASGAGYRTVLPVLSITRRQHRSHSTLHGSCGASAEGSVIQINFATYIEDVRRGRI